MTTTFNNPFSGFMTFLLIVAIIAGAIGFVAIQADVIPSIHATAKHGTDAEMARSCLQDKSSTVFMNSQTNRFGIVCNVEGVWGIVILDSARKEITAFVKNKMKSFDQVLQYMRNAGYEIVH